jgi:aminopeptidase N
MRWRLVGALAIALVTTLAIRGEDPFSFEKTPGRLPKTVVPRHYAIELEPDAAALTTSGSVRIDLEVRETVRTLTFNALDLEFTTAAVDGVAQALPRLEAESQTAVMSLSADLPPGRHQLSLGFRARITRHATGLYAEKYHTPEGERIFLGTQLEPTEARRILPCWDEPAFRATFQLTVRIPSAHTAVSNTPITSERTLGGGRREVAFAPTPAMSSYLLVLCVGELEALRDEIDGVQLAIWTRRGRTGEARYAMEVTKQVVGYFNEYFGTRYPLPKLDQIAVPGGFSGAMENWGGITYIESAILFDPANSSQSTKEGIFSIIAHEIAHQWFGNLVTMAWWDNLWLNEGFASWMGTKATDHFNPGWQVWLRANDEKESAMGLDARRSTHPIQQPVATEAEASDAFDEITYSKGQAFLRMLETFVGESDFRTGIRSYLQRHAYSNTTTADLWTALEAASGKPVRTLANGWTTQPGFPVVQVAAREADGRFELTLKQERFSVSDPAPAPQTWQIPVSLGPVGQPAAVQTVLLEGESATVAAPGRPGSAVKINHGNTGYYRAAYSPPLAAALAASFALLSEDDRVNLLSDAWALAEAGRGDAGEFLSLVARLDPGEKSLAIWEQVLRSFGQLERLTRGTQGRDAFDRWWRERLRGPFGRVGWDARPGERSNDAVLRSRLIQALGLVGDSEIIAEARRRFQAFTRDSASLAADLRSPVCRLAGWYADAPTWEKLHSLAREATSTEEQNRYYQACQEVRDPGLAKRTLELALTEERTLAQWFWIVPQVARFHPELAWAFTKANVSALLAKVPAGGAFLTRNTFFPAIAESFSEAARADELIAFVSEQVGAAGAAEAARMAELIRFRAGLRARVVPQVTAWIAAHPRS